MAKLSYIEKEAIEHILKMGDGYVSDFTNNQFANFFFTTSKIKIYDDKYAKYGNSKANRLRTFIEIAPQKKTALILEQLLERESKIDQNLIPSQVDTVKKLINRLYNKDNVMISSSNTKSFDNLDLTIFNFDPTMLKIIKQRLAEIDSLVKNQINLSAIILIGSTLEGILYTVAKNQFNIFSKAKCVPKDKNGNILEVEKWKLVDLISVASEVGFITQGIEDFSQQLRDYRNFIHPLHQQKYNFFADKHSVDICMQVFNSAIANLVESLRKP